MGKKRKRHYSGRHSVQNARKKRRLEETERIKELDARCQSEAPPEGVNILALDEETCEERNIIIPKTFAELPLTNETQEALKENKFYQLRDIQKASLLHALTGRDVLGAARTGSGKTLCFLIPMVERLYRLRWNPEDGVGGMVISPTRELATQIFEVLRKVGANHRFSAGLVIGGKNFQAESKRIHGMNILICTPGRLLQHMEETYGFYTDNVKVLILDEADRILDMGFQHQIENIIDNLPVSRQTLLFSATLSKSVTKLAKLSLRNPQYIKALDTSAKPTPKKLIESYLIIEAKDKLNFLWTFLRTHVKQKSMVFLTTRKQVRYVFEMFRKLQPGCPVKHMHGKMVQQKRMAVYYDFLERKGGCVLFTTQVASRGLDFPDVNWVLLMDCPSDVQSYVHTVGRTARNFAQGNSLQLLLPSEKQFLNHLKKANINPKKLVVKTSKLRSITGTLTSLMVENSELKYLGERAFISYVRSLFLETDKTVFKPEAIDFPALTKAMGLPGTPQIEGKNITSRNKLKNIPYALQEMLGLAKTTKQTEEMSYVDRMISRKSEGAYSERKEKLRAVSDSEDEDDFFTPANEQKPVAKVPQAMTTEEKAFIDSDDSDSQEDYMEQLKDIVRHNDPKDKLDDQARVREMHQTLRWKERQENKDEAMKGQTLVTLDIEADEEDQTSGAEDANSSSEEEDLEAKALALMNE